MFEFSKSKSAKAVSAFVSVMTVALMLGPVTASAAALSAGQIQSILSLLQSFGADTATINNVSASLNGMPTTPVTPSTSGTGYQFKTDLTIGAKGADVVALQDILVAGGYLVMPSGVAKGTFGPLTQSAVAKWQASAGITPAAGYVGPKSRAALNAMGGSSTTPTTPGTTPVAGAVSASLASDSPVAATLITGSVGTIAKFTLTNGNSAAVKVTGLKLTRTGVSSDSTLNNVYLYNGAQRVTDAASISIGKINFSDTMGIVTVPAMGSVTLSVRVEVAAGTNGQTVGVMLTDVMTDATGATTGLPVSASQHNIATAPSGMTTVDFTGTMTPAAASVDPQDDYTIWQSNVNIGNRDAVLKSLRYRQIGSVLPADLANFRLMVDGAQVGATVAALDSMGYVTFDLTAAPKTLTSGTRVVKLVANIVSGSGRNFKFSLRQASDLQVADSQLGVDLLPTVSSSAFTARESGQQDVNAGVLTITKETDSPSGNVTNQASNITLAKYKFKAQGERIKVESLRVGHSSTTASLRNGSIVANGTQIGSVSPIAAAGTTINLGSSLIVEPGKDVIVEIKGDIYTTVNAFLAGETLTVSLLAGSSNAQRLVKLDYVNSPASTVSGNSLTVAAGSMTLSKFTAFANQTLVVPQTAVKIGEYRLQSGSTEDVNLNTLTVGVNSTTTSAITDLYVTYGAKTTPVKASVSSGNNTWSINEALAKNSTLEIKVYATLSTVFTGQASTTASVDGNAVSSGSAVTSGTVVGQTVTSGSGEITSALAASTPVTAIAIAGTETKVGSFKFTATNDTFTIYELYSSLNSTSSASVVAEVIWKDGATELGRSTFDALRLESQTLGVEVAVSPNTSKVLDAYLKLGNVNTPGAGTTSQAVTFSLTGFWAQNTNSDITEDETQVDANPAIVYKTKPTISNVALPSTTLTAGTQTLAKVSIASDAAGSLEWKKLTFNIAKAGSALAIGTTTFAIYEDSNQSTALASTLTTTGAWYAGGAGGTVTFDLDVPQGVSGSKTYVVKATVGSVVAGNSISTNILQGTSAAAATAYADVDSGSNLVWSDLSMTPHTLQTADWLTDYLIKNLPTDSQTLTK
jgi:hypothetical protein